MDERLRELDERGKAASIRGAARQQEPGSSTASSSDATECLLRLPLSGARQQAHPLGLHPAPDLQCCTACISDTQSCTDCAVKHRGLHESVGEGEGVRRIPEAQRDIGEKTAERLKLKKAAHAARQNLARARKIARAIETGGRHLGGLWQWEKTLLEDLNSGKLAQVVDECDAAFGWNQQMRDKAGTAAGRLCPRGSSKTAVLHSPRHPATAANSASESSGPVESNASAAQPGPSTKRERSTDGHASAAQPGFAAISSSSTGVI